MTAAISGMHSQLFRGGGSYRKPIFESLADTFGSTPFTFRQANEQIEGFNRSTCRDFLAARLIKCNTRTYPFYYRVHQSIPTHKLTHREIIDRMIKRTDTIFSVVSEFREQSYEKDTGVKTHGE
jgi:hypothetical protein